MTNVSAHSGDRQRTCALTTKGYQILNELRHNNLLYDARIPARVDLTDASTEFPVHRFILAGK